MFPHGDIPGGITDDLSKFYDRFAVGNVGSGDLVTGCGIAGERRISTDGQGFRRKGLQQDNHIVALMKAQDAWHGIGRHVQFTRPCYPNKCSKWERLAPGDRIGLVGRSRLDFAMGGIHVSSSISPD